MAISLFVSKRCDGLAFYINGQLQFDTADEAIYHELLVIPAIALAIKRFADTELRVLICGGGDGLAAREALRFPQVHQIDLVDQSPEVLQLAGTVFKAFNRGSLESDRLTVYTEEALSFVSKLPDCSYHVVICDFTYPTTAAETSIHSQEWYDQVRRILFPEGILSINGVSPETTTRAFWCLYQTLLAARLSAKPLQVVIPSFLQHCHGIWGFFLASSVALCASEVQAIPLPENLQFLTPSHLQQAFIFDQGIAAARHQLTINTLDCPQLFYYMLNPDASGSVQKLGETVNFLEIQEIGTGQIGLNNPFSLVSVSHSWLSQMPQSLQIIQGNSPPNLDISRLLPVQHFHHSPQMSAEWLSYTQKLVGAVDISRLAKALDKRTEELPPDLRGSVRFAITAQKGKNPPLQLLGFEPIFIILVAVIMLIANLSSRDSAFGKGNSDNYPVESNGSSNLILILGLILTAGGGIWLLMLLFEYFTK